VSGERKRERKEKEREREKEKERERVHSWQYIGMPLRHPVCMYVCGESEIWRERKRDREREQ